MKKVIFILIMIINNCCALEIFNLEQNILINIQNTKILHGKTIAVYDIKPIEIQDDRLKYISTQEIINALIKSKLVKVVERKDLKAYISEYQLSLSNMAENKSNKSNKMLIADYLLTGTIYKKQNFYEVNIKISDAKSMQVITTIKNKIYDDLLNDKILFKGKEKYSVTSEFKHTDKEVTLSKIIESINDIEIYYYALIKNKIFRGLNTQTEEQKLNRIAIYYNEESNKNSSSKIILKSYSNNNDAYKVGQKIFRLLKKKGISRSNMIIKSFNTKIKCDKNINNNCKYIHTKVLFEFL